jgi:transposase
MPGMTLRHVPVERAEPSRRRRRPGHEPVELAWQDVLFKGFEVLVTTTVHGAWGIVVRLGVRRDAGSCPACGRASTRVHNRYERHLQDLALAGHAVRILLSVRRFVCADGARPQRTFTEQIPGLTSPYARVTDRLGALLDRIALALAGRAGTRMANALGLAAGRMGLLNPDSCDARPVL